MAVGIENLEMYQYLGVFAFILKVLLPIDSPLEARQIISKRLNLYELFLNIFILNHFV
jgi:hypothetical protein